MQEILKKISNIFISRHNISDSNTSNDTTTSKTGATAKKEEKKNHASPSRKINLKNAEAQKKEKRQKRNINIPKNVNSLI